eukprot:Gb_26990 [translate_table: standard]
MRQRPILCVMFGMFVGRYNSGWLSREDVQMEPGAASAPKGYDANHRGVWSLKNASTRGFAHASTDTAAQTNFEPLWNFKRLDALSSVLMWYRDSRDMCSRFPLLYPA